MSNLVEDYPSFTKTHKSSIKLILTNKEHSFQLTKATDSGVSDFHLLISTFTKAQTTGLPLKTILCRDFKNFNEKAFLEDVKLKHFSRKSDDSNKNYEFVLYQFQSVVIKHVPLKTKIVRGNNAPFVNKTSRKEIYKRSALRSKFLEDASDSNWQKYRKQRSKCVNIRQKCIKEHFQSITRHGVMTSRKFWAMTRPF